MLRRQSSVYVNGLFTSPRSPVIGLWLGQAQGLRSQMGGLGSARTVTLSTVFSGSRVRTAGRKTSSLSLYVSLNATYVARIPDLVTPGIQTLTIVSPFM
jgi:hypothetical protein